MSYFEKKLSERIACRLNASIIADSGVYLGSIENISEKGLLYSLSSSDSPTKGRSLTKRIRLMFSIFLDEVISLECNPTWHRPDQSEDQILIGMKIINPPPRYNELIRNIYLCKYL